MKNSLTRKLAAIFLVMAVPPLLIGLNASFSMRTAFASLDENDRSLRNLSTLLQSAKQTLEEGARLQDNAKVAASRMADAQNRTSLAFRSTAETTLPKSDALSRIRMAIRDANAAERALLLALNMRHLSVVELAAVRDEQYEALVAASDAIDEARAVYESRIAADGERRAWDAFVLALDDWWRNHDEFMREIGELDLLVGDLVRAGPLFSSAARKAYETAFAEGKAIRDTCEQRLAALAEELTRATAEGVQGVLRSQDASAGLLADLDRETNASAARSAGLAGQFDRALAAAGEASRVAASALDGTISRFWILTVLSLAAIAVSVCLGIYLASRLSRPVRAMALHMNQLARGNVSADVPPEVRSKTDEIGLLARAMQELVHANRMEIAMANAMAAGDYTKSINLRSDDDQLGRALQTMLATSNATLRRVGGAVGRMTEGAQTVSEASRALSQGAETSAQALEEINLSMGHVDAQAKENAARASEANKLATDSRDAARRGYDAVTELVTAMTEIRSAGAKIGTVAKLIDDIAFQTNLLALNAAVEAARAGRQGRGFSIVADEVRNLSGRSAKAARETGDMVEAMTEQMRMGTELAARTDNEFREIVEATSQVALLFQDISAASAAQSSAMAEIAGGLGQIDGVIQENTQSAGSTASSAQELSRQAEELSGAISRFRLVSGSGRIAGARGGMEDAPRPAGRALASGRGDRLLPGGPA